MENNTKRTFAKMKSYAAEEAKDLSNLNEGKKASVIVYKDAGGDYKSYPAIQGQTPKEPLVYSAIKAIANHEDGLTTLSESRTEIEKDLKELSNIKFIHFQM